MHSFRKIIVSFIVSLIPFIAYGQEYWHDIPRTVRYKPDGEKIVIKNGDKRFNRALYGTHSDFRAEAGDLPEFALFLPNMGGTIRLGIMNKETSKWLIHADEIIAEYKPGTMHYKIKDALLENAVLHISVMAMHNAEGIILKCNVSGETNADLVLVYGGACGKRFGRNGDIGADPESGFYLHPEYCINDKYEIYGSSFSLDYVDMRGKDVRTLKGLFPQYSVVKVKNANFQDNPEHLWTSEISDTALVAGKLSLTEISQEFYFSVFKPETIDKYEYSDVEEHYANGLAYWNELANRVKLESPDPYLNTLGGVLSVAADAVWDGEAFMHGAVAWRMPLNGWRGASQADPLGRSDRAKTHFRGYAKAQYLEPDSGPTVHDPDKGFARQQEKAGVSLFTKGYISRRPGEINKPHHYDMNLVFIDQVIRHLDWTGDTAFLREMWPVIERHMEWEKRCFDGNRDGLYDAYCCIWASDALQYSGGGVTHSSAYNYFSNMKVARLAEILGKDSEKFIKEAEKIHHAMMQNLWIQKSGHFAEYIDLLGHKLLHPDAAVWTYYHTIDSKVANPVMAYRMMDHLKNNIPRIPIRAEGLDENLYTISTTDWMPYTWSINNVALAEVMHTTLAYWQAGMNEEAFWLWKSALIESMYLGSSPGNIQQLSFYDAYRGELYRDFADPVGMVSRTLTEGLFGIQPDAMNDKLVIQPGLPMHWENAKLELPEVKVDFTRSGNTDTYSIEQAFPKTLQLIFKIKARKASIIKVTVNDKEVPYITLNELVVTPAIEIDCGKLTSCKIAVEWGNENLENTFNRLVTVHSQRMDLITEKAHTLSVLDPEGALTGIELYQKGLSAVTDLKSGQKTFFVKLKQNSFEWWQPIQMDVIQPLTITLEDRGDERILYLTNNLKEKVKLDVDLNYNIIESKLTIKSESTMSIQVNERYFVPGTNVFHVQGIGIQQYFKVTDWDKKLEKTTKSVHVLMDDKLNDKVNQLFKNKYESPRSPFPTLQLPVNGIGNWCYNTIDFEIDDSGLRKKAGRKNLIQSGIGIDFLTSGNPENNNVLFTSIWDNYPDMASIDVTGYASHAYFLMAGTTNPMQSRLTNGTVSVFYKDGSSDVLELVNPDTWWPIEQDYFQDGYAFNIETPVPYRLHLKTGKIVKNNTEFTKIKGFTNKAIEGGAATILDLPLNPGKELDEIVLETLAIDVVIGLMAITLVK